MFSLRFLEETLGIGEKWRPGEHFDEFSLNIWASFGWGVW